MTAPQALTDSRQHQASRSGLRACAGLLAGLIAAALLAPLPAEAAAYRYWSYWSGTSGTWTYASVGAGSTRPADGAVEGWRFAVSEGASSSSTAPRTGTSFKAICGDVSGDAGQKRVAVVVDFGVASDAPSGERPPNGVVVHCAVVPTSASGAAVLLDAFTVRSSNGLVCGINGYPRSECAAVLRDVPDPEPSSSAPRATSQPPGEVAGASPRVAGKKLSATTGPRSTPMVDDGPAESPTTAETAPPTGPASPSNAPEAASTDDPLIVTTAVPTSDSGSPVGLLVAGALLGGFGATALALKRRRP